MMKGLFRAFTAAAAAAVLCMCSAISVSAENVTLEFEAQESDGHWGPSVKYFTALDTSSPAAPDEVRFDPTQMTDQSVVKVTYESGGPAKHCHIELVWQTWDNPDPNIKDWTTISARKYDTGYAEFYYEDIVEAYGSDDFSQVYKISVSDRGIPVTVTDITITNVGDVNEPRPPVEKETEPPETESQTETETEPVTEPETEPVTSETTVSETTPSPLVTMHTPSYSVQNDDATIKFLTIAVIVVIAAAVGFVIFLIISYKKMSGKSKK